MFHIHYGASISKNHSKSTILQKRGRVSFWFALSKITRRTYWQIDIDGMEMKLCNDHPYQNLIGRSLKQDQGENNLLFAWKKTSEHSNVILDIGGYNGMYGILSGLTNPLATVYIFEPDPINIQCIQKNIALNNVHNVTIVPSVIFDTVGKVGFREHPGGTGGNVTNENKFEVDSITLDRWSEQHHQIPDLIKMDVEGAEYRALKGGSKMLAAAPHTTLFLEVHQQIITPRFGDSEQAVYDLLSQLQYRYFFLDKNTATTHCLVTK